MVLPDVLESGVEKFRTDPTGFAFLGLGLAIPILLEKYEELPPAVSHTATAASLGLVAVGLVHLRNMFNYAERTETSLREVGFEDTQFRVRAYCLRQASRVVCQKTGHLEEFVKLCNSKDKLRYSFLPHI